MPGRYTPMLMQHVMEAGFCVREARTVKASARARARR